jgi:hypothetical protein
MIAPHLVGGQGEHAAELAVHQVIRVDLFPLRMKVKWEIWEPF